MFSWTTDKNPEGRRTEDKASKKIKKMLSIASHVNSFVWMPLSEAFCSQRERHEHQTQTERLGFCLKPKYLASDEQGLVYSLKTCKL